MFLSSYPFCFLHQQHTKALKIKSLIHQTNKHGHTLKWTIYRLPWWSILNLKNDLDSNMVELKCYFKCSWITVLLGYVQNEQNQLNYRIIWITIKSYPFLTWCWNLVGSLAWTGTTLPYTWSSLTMEQPDRSSGRKVSGEHFRNLSKPIRMSCSGSSYDKNVSQPPLAQ